MLCSVEGCEREKRVRGWCIQHYNRWIKTGDVGRVDFEMTGPSHPNWRGREVGYRGAHDRVKRRRGSAKKQRCAHCDGPAATWAYDGSDPDEITDDEGRRYSGDPDHYFPLCAKCHCAMDGYGWRPGRGPRRQGIAS